MATYYNEIDPFAAQWLRNLIAAGHIADGVVDERSIEDIVPQELEGFTQCHFFAGIGVWSLALRRAGWPDERPVWTGSCPCQPFSAAGKGGGFADERHLWPSFFHLIEQRKPPIIFGEQVAGREGFAWLDLVQADLEAADYACGAINTCAAGFGAPHVRQRLYWAAEDAYTYSNRLEAISDESKLRQPPTNVGGLLRLGEVGGSNVWAAARPSGVRPVVLGDGDAANLGRIRAYGNALVLPQAAAFVKAYLG